MASSGTWTVTWTFAWTLTSSLAYARTSCAIAETRSRTSWVATIATVGGGGASFGYHRDISEYNGTQNRESGFSSILEELTTILQSFVVSSFHNRPMCPIDSSDSDIIGLKMKSVRVCTCYSSHTLRLSHCPSLLNEQLAEASRKYVNVSRSLSFLSKYNAATRYYISTRHLLLLHSWQWYWNLRDFKVSRKNVSKRFSVMSAPAHIYPYRASADDMRHKVTKIIESSIIQHQIFGKY